MRCCWCGGSGHDFVRGVCVGGGGRSVAPRGELLHPRPRRGAGERGTAGHTAPRPCFQVPLRGRSKLVAGTPERLRPALTNLARLLGSQGGRARRGAFGLQRRWRVPLCAKAGERPRAPPERPEGQRAAFRSPGRGGRRPLAAPPVPSADPPSPGWSAPHSRSAYLSGWSYGAWLSWREGGEVGSFAERRNPVRPTGVCPWGGAGIPSPPTCAAGEERVA